MSKTCVFVEAPIVRRRRCYDHDFYCRCSLCGWGIELKADFEKNGDFYGKILKIHNPINYCAFCGAKIEKFVQYEEDAK